MNEEAEINYNSWRLAAASIVRDKKSAQPYSTSQIRKIMNASKSPDFKNEITNVIENYTPAPPQGRRPEQARNEIQLKRKKNIDFGNSLLEMVENRNSLYVQNLLKYTLWNIRIIENNINDMDKLKLLLDCEKIQDKEGILNILETI
jgi:hypothetical protein